MMTLYYLFGEFKLLTRRGGDPSGAAACIAHGYGGISPVNQFEKK
jgi:hypothetical protein